MQDGFLFDDGDPKQRGKNCDRLGTKEDGLKADWYWGTYKIEKKPGQVCFAEIGEGFTLEAVFWHKDYGAAVNYYGDHIASYRPHSDEDETALVTRLQAQLKAEQLFVDFYKKLGILLAENLI